MWNVGERHNHCYTSPVYREKVWEMNRRLAEKFAGHPGVIAWHISNEYGGACWCEKCQEAFRGYLKQKYGSLEELNRQWWTAFWSHRYDCWEHVQAPSPLGESDTHGLNLDWRRFCSLQTADFCAWEKKALEAGGSSLPVTTNLMGFYDGLDYADFRDILELSSWDSYPEWHSGEKSDVQTAAEIACTAGRSQNGVDTVFIKSLNTLLQKREIVFSFLRLQRGPGEDSQRHHINPGSLHLPDILLQNIRAVQPLIGIVVPAM